MPRLAVVHPIHRPQIYLFSRKRNGAAAPPDETDVDKDGRRHPHFGYLGSLVPFGRRRASVGRRTRDSLRGA